MSVIKLAHRSLFPRVSAISRNYATEIEPVKKGRKAQPFVKPPKPLQSPKNKRFSAYTLFIQNFAQERKKAGEKWLLQDASTAYKALPDSEKSKLLEQLPELVAQQKAIYDEFVKNLSPADILAENKTRAALRKTKIAAGKSVRNLAPIVDPNAPKKPMNAFLSYLVENRGNPEYSGMTVSEQAKAIGEKWKQLGESEKSRYQNVSEKALNDWKQKTKEYYGQID